MRDLKSLKAGRSWCLASLEGAWETSTTCVFESRVAEPYEPAFTYMLPGQVSIMSVGSPSTSTIAHSGSGKFSWSKMLLSDSICL